MPSQLSPRAYGQYLTSGSWEEIWEAGPYYDRISELLEDATQYAIFVGWQIDSRLRLKIPARGQDGTLNLSSGFETLREKVLRLCECKPHFHFYFLLWDHAYIYVLEREFWQTRLWEDLHSRVHFVFDNRHPLGASHHEKICIIDGRVALCGGIDLCDERWDCPQHLYSDPRRSLKGRSEHHGPYHDLAVQVSGAVCRELQKHVGRRWRALSTIPFPQVGHFMQKDCGEGHWVYLSRTFASINENSSPP